MKYLICFLALLSFEVSANPNSCASDAKKFCQSVEPGKGQLAKCLSDFESQLSSTCRNELKSYKSKTAKKNPCFEDLAEFCVDIPADARNLEYCLLKNESRLGESCSADFKKKKGNILVKNVCAQDIVNNCYAEVSGPDGAINRCLIRNKAKLSKFCQSKVEKKIADLKKKNPCFDDTEEFCPTQVKVIDIHECLNKKTSSLAPTCKKVVEAEEKKAVSNPCYKELMRHCRPGLSPEEQHRCLIVNEAELGNACKQFRAREEDKIKKMVEACEPDRLKFCEKVPVQGGKVLRCLKENKTKLSKSCASLI